MPTIKINTCDKEWFGRDYVFYNKNGDPMNILYDATLDIYKGKLYFPENSSDTFQTLEINTFERIRGFEYQQYNTGTGGTGSTASDELFTEKFQLFNTEGIDFISNTFSVVVTKIESVNKRADFYSKWIYGQSINALFPSGTEIKFNRDIFGINSKETYTVIKTKRDAIMIITSTDNKNFVQNIGGVINNESEYTDLNIAGVNAIKIYNYIDGDYKNNFPDWSEPNFYNQIYTGQKVNIINSENNEGTFTLKEISLGDNYYNNFRLLTDNFDNNLRLQITNNTSNIILYSGPITINATNSVIEINKSVSALLQPGKTFRIPLSNSNLDPLTVAPISSFDSVSQTFYVANESDFTLSSQVLFESKIYNCIQSYTQSASSSVSPLDTNYWEESKFIPILQVLTDEQLNGELYLETNKIDLSYTYDNSASAIVNLNNAFTIFEESLDDLGLVYEIDRLGEFALIKSKYPTNYIDIEAFVDKVDTFSGSTTNGTNFSPTGFTVSSTPHPTTTINVTLNDNNISVSEDYLSSTAFVYLSDSGSASSNNFNDLSANTELYWKELNANFGLTASDVVTLSYISNIASKETIIERIVETEETLINEKNSSYAIRPEERILFTDIDDFGISITINGQIYDIDSTILLRGNGDIDIEESIDRTLKEWVNRWRLELDKLGIFIDSEYFGNNNLTNLDNSLFFRGYYPNVPLEVSDIRVGDGASYNILDKYVIFYKLGGQNTQLNITINNISYVEVFSSNVETTLDNWINTHTEVLNQFGIYVRREHQVLIFEKLDNVDIVLDINVGQLFLPGDKAYEIIEYSKRNEGVILASNKLIQNNNEISFEEECFSTGQIISINNSDWTINNQEYNVIQLNPDRMVLSYQGPFWGTIDNSIQNAFFALSFGENFNIGDQIVYIADGNTNTGIVTSVANNFYQVLDGNDVVTVERTNAFYFDPNANNLAILPEDEVLIRYLELDGNIVDVDYFNTTSDISIVSDTVYFVDSEDIRLDETLNIQQAIKQIVNPVNNLLYVLSADFVYIIDPFIKEIKATVNNLGVGFDITADSRLGDVYVSYTDNDRIMIIDKDTFSFISFDYYSGHQFGKLTYNRDDETVYVFSRINEDISTLTDKVIYRVNTDTKLRDTGFLVSGTFSQNIGLGATGSTTSYLGLSEESGKLHYNPYNGEMYVASNGKLNLVDIANDSLTELNISTENYYSVSLDDFNKYMWVSSSDNILSAIEESGDIIKQEDISTYGFIFVNPTDSNIYLASQDGTDKLRVYSTFLDETFYTFDLEFELDKLTLNRKRESINGISLNDARLVDIKINFIYGLKSFSTTFNQSFTAYNDSEKFEGDENQFGTLADDFELSDFLQIKTREFIRKPRKNYETTGATQAVWSYKWDNLEDSIFLIDITGEFLPTSGSYAYTGPKPLNNPIVKKETNNNLDLTDKSYAQQTVFESLSYTLDYNDSDDNVSFIPMGIQTFIGFNSKDEEVSNKILGIYESEAISLSFASYDAFTSSTFSTVLPDQNITFLHNEETGYGEIILSNNSTDSFSEIVNLNDFTSFNTNLNNNQNINIRLIDNTSIDKYISPNDNLNVKILNIFERKLIVDYLSDDTFQEESTKLTDRFLRLDIDVLDKKVIEFDIYGQTEIEDIRYKTELNNIGKAINPDDIFIFKDYDINEGGIDWQFMNAKRKELLTVKNDIYNYLGAYRSLINAINYFGYNDLILNEYFQNINPESAEYLNLYKVEIDDLFDNSSTIWTENYRFYQFPNENYEETKLFNLTYKITDFDGNKLITYSIEEAIIKLQGLKFWLEKNIVPITHDIRDIAGELSFKYEDQNFDLPSSINILNMKDVMAPIDFEINETYALPIQSGSNVYNTVIDFTVGDITLIPDYFSLEINTYKVYEKWDPFFSYNYGDKVDYFGKIYENVFIDPSAETLGQDPTAVINTNNNPLEYDEVTEWDVNANYVDNNLVIYDRRIYQYSLRTPTANYLPWVGATGTCIVGTPSTTNDIDDNYYTDLLDRIGNEPNVPSYFNTIESNIRLNFDVLDIMRNNYPTQWCDLLDRDSELIRKLANDILNLPENQFEGVKPGSKTAARRAIFKLINDFNSIKSNYKLKFLSLTPRENILLDNADFILWDDVTKWRVADLDPVQNITEFRSGKDMMKPFNFTLDSQIDPFVVISCKSDNGYGQIKNIRKSYELRFNADSESLLVTPTEAASTTNTQSLQTIERAETNVSPLSE